MASKEGVASCKICLETYRDPRCLECGHSFCLECIKGVADDKKWFLCPLCQVRINLRNGKVDQLPKNYALIDVIEDKDKTYHSMCLNDNKLLDIFCKQCDMVICSTCLLMQHRDHVIEHMDKIFNERNEQLGAFFADTKLSVSMIQEKRSVIEQSRNAMQKSADSIHKAVDNMFKKWYDDLNAKQYAVLSYLYQERDKKIQVYVEAESVLLKSLTNVTELEEEISQTRSKDMAFVIQQYGSIRARHEDTKRIVVLNINACFTPPDDLKIEVCAPWIEEAISNIKYIDMMKRKARPQTRKISEIEKENNFLKRNMKQLECENKLLKTFLSDLHKYGTSHTKGSTFEKPCSVKPDKAVTTQYQQAQDIYNTFKEMERKYDVLVNETEALQMTLEEMTTTLFREEHESLPLQDTVQLISTKIDSLMSDLDSVKTEKKQLQSACNKLSLTNDTCKRDNEQLQKSVQAVKQCLSEKEQKVSELQKKIDSLMLDLESVKTEKKQLQSAFNKLLITNDTCKRNNEQLQKSAQDVKQCLSEKEQKVSDLQKKIDSLMSDLESVKTEKKQLQSAFNKLLITNDTCKRNNEQLQKSAQDVKQCLSEKEQKVSDLQKQIDSLMSDLESVKTEKKQLQSTFNTLLITNGTNKRVNEQLQKSVQDVKESLCEEEQKVSVLQEKVQSMVCELESAKTKICQLQKTNDTYEQKNKALQMSIALKDECLSQKEEKISVLNMTMKICVAIFGLLLIVGSFWS